MKPDILNKSITEFWDNKIVPTLIEYIKIPNKSPSFDPDWEKHGHMDRVLDLAVKWTEKNKPDGSVITIKKSPGRTPLLLLDIPGTKDGNILMYGHLDKQPEMEGWNEDLGPWKPVIKDEKLYGRGGADDGYALFASVASVKALKEQNIDHPRILVLIEFSEESGSPDLPHYMDLCADIIGAPNLVICLDSGAGDYKRFWTTTSLRGLIGLKMKVEVLREGVHSGGASGHVPSSFRVARILLSRLEDEKTGEILIDELNTEIPDYRIEETKNLVSILNNEVVEEFPWKNNMKPSTNDNVEGVLRRTWKPAVSIVGVDGMPSTANAGNVLRPYTTLQLSIRIPPTTNAKKAVTAMKKTLSENIPYDATVELQFEKAGEGWNAPESKPWLLDAIDKASKEYFGQMACSMGEGGSIPFMGMLGKQFPEAQFVITGVLGPQSNAHGPNEFLHIPFAKRLTCCISSIIADYK